MADVIWIEYGYFWDENNNYHFGEVVHESFKAESYVIVNKLYEIVGDALWNCISVHDNIMEITTHNPEGELREIYVQIKEKS